MKTPALRFRSTATLCFFLLIATALAACSGGSGGSGVGHQSVAFTHESSDASRVYVTGSNRGFVTLRRSSGPVAHFMLSNGQLARFEHKTGQATMSLKVGQTSITRADVDADGELEIVVDGPDGTTTYQQEDMDLGEAQSRTQSLMSLDELDDYLVQTFEDLSNFHHGPRVKWVVDELDAAGDAADSIGKAIDDLDKTVSDWKNRDWLADEDDNDRELVSEEPIEVPTNREEPTVIEIYDEVRDRVSGRTPSTNHFTDSIGMRVSHDSTVPTEWAPERSTDGVNHGVDSGTNNGTDGDTFKCFASYQDETGRLALIENTCTDDAASFVAMGGEAIEADSASACAQWCEHDNGVHFGSSDNDGSNLFCYQAKCVSELGLVSDPKPLADDEACAAGCEAEYCERNDEPWVEMTFEGETILFEGREVESKWYDRTLRDGTVIDYLSAGAKTSTPLGDDDSPRDWLGLNQPATRAVAQRPMILRAVRGLSAAITHPATRLMVASKHTAILPRREASRSPATTAFGSMEPSNSSSTANSKNRSHITP